MHCFNCFVTQNVLQGLVFVWNKFETINVFLMLMDSKASIFHGNEYDCHLIRSLQPIMCENWRKNWKIYANVEIALQIFFPCYTFTFIINLVEQQDWMRSKSLDEFKMAINFIIPCRWYLLINDFKNLRHILKKY